MPRTRCGAFTLVELIAVMGVMLIFISLSVPLIGDVMASRATERAALDLSRMMEYARREAVALQTYAWVAIEEVEEGGQPGLRATVRVSRMGAIDPVTTGSGASARTLVNMDGVDVATRVYHWRGVELIEPDKLERVDAPEGLVSFAAEPTSGFASMVNVGTPTRPRMRAEPTYMHTVTFGPSGAAFVASVPRLSDPYSEHIGVGLKYAGRGDEALLYLNGLTGATRVAR